MDTMTKNPDGRIGKYRYRSVQWLADRHESMPTPGWQHYEVWKSYVLLLMSLEDACATLGRRAAHRKNSKDYSRSGSKVAKYSYHQKRLAGSGSAFFMLQDMLKSSKYIEVAVIGGKKKVRWTGKMPQP